MNSKKLLLSLTAFLAVGDGVTVANNRCRKPKHNSCQSVGYTCKETDMFVKKDKEASMHNEIQKSHNTPEVKKFVLENGMTVLVLENHAIPKVSLQIFYNVGSIDENNGEKGIAHLIEHMIFKGTQGKDSLNLSESDINTIMHTLSGSCNAFTTQDYTGYLFNMPTQHWKEALPIMADCMLNTSFKDDHLDSEMKAVIQELKMRRDRYSLALIEEMLTTIFPDHPYHYPIIGYKQDLWNVHGKDLKAFYKKHYHPNNATLVVVGDVNTGEVFKLAQDYFGKIKPNYDYPRPEFYYNRDIIAKSVTLYRDVQQPTVIMAYEIPGLKAKKKSVIDIISWLLGQGKSSRLYKKLVDETHLATSLSSFYWDSLFEHALFFIAFEPKDIQDIDNIIAIIQAEIKSIIVDGVQDQELTRAIKKAQMDYYSTLEDIETQAYDIGKGFLATGDENFVFDYLTASEQEIKKDVVDLLAEYFRPAVMHVGKVLPLPAGEKKTWADLQVLSDKEDTRILSARVRTSPIEKPSYATTVKEQPATKFDFPKAQEIILSNGLKVLYYLNTNTPKIDIVLRFKALSCYDPEDMQGLYYFMTSMLSEGTENYSAMELSDELESRGMSFGASPGGMNMSLLAPDLHKGLELLQEIVTNATFDEQEVEKVRQQLLVDLKNFWDNPANFANYLVKNQLYAGHPYSKNILGSAEVVSKITAEDLRDFYKKVITPKGASIAIVGDLTGYDVPAVLEETLGNWTGLEVPTIEFPPLQKKSALKVTHPINRDQVTLCFAGLSVDRNDPDYDKLVLFDQILGGGVLNSMKSRLFKLREQSGLFYSISGSLTAFADEQPGMVLVKTLVSLDRLDEAEKAILNTLKHVADEVSEQEFTEAKNAIANTLMNNFQSNASMAASFLFLDKYKLPANYFDTRAQKLEAITIPEMQAAVKRVLNADQLNIFKIGRVE